MTIAILTFVLVLVVVLAVIVVVVMMGRPGWKRIRELGPAVFAGGHLRVIQQAGIKLCGKFPCIEVDSHESNCLAAVAERFPPFLSRALGHLGLAGMLVTSGPPFSGGRIMRFRTRQVKAADQVHSCREPKETFYAEDTRETALQQIPKPLRMEWLSGTIGERRYVILSTWASLLRVD